MRNDMRGQVKASQKQVQARRRRKIIYVSVFSFVSLVLLFFGLAWFSQAQFMTISSIEISGNNRASDENIKEIANQYIAGNYLGLFSKRNIFLYPQNLIHDALIELPITSEADVDTSGFKILSISIIEREEKARWCNDFDCFSIDENGFIFDKSNGISESRSGVVYRSAIDNPIGSYVLATEDFKRIQFFINQLGGLSVDPREITFGEAGYINILLGKGGVLTVNTTDNLSSVLDNVSTVLNDKTLASSSLSFLESLDYMRLDSGNRVFYKLKH